VSTVVSTRTAVVAASRPLVRAGLRAATASDGVVVAASTEPSSLADAVEVHEPDLVVVAVTAVDVDPYSEIARVMSIDPACHVLAIVEDASVIDLREAIVAGVQSLLLADVELDELRDAIIGTVDGERVLAPEVAVQLADSWTADRADVRAQLTARELEVLQHLAEGRTNAQVADELGVSPRTVKTHVQNLLAKLDTPDRTGAVAQGFRRGLIS
jgi:DNA-binding NarL/FixJ family response regulator